MKNIISILCFVLLVSGCEKMNDKHDQYLENGEIVYIGTIDSLKVFPGNERIKFKCWVGDPRVKTLKLYWSNKKDSLTVSIPEHDAEVPFEVQIGKNEKAIVENTYTFQWISWDQTGHHSIKYEKIANVYGSRYESRLTNRIISTVETLGSTMTIKWMPSLSSQEVALEMTYTNTSGQEIVRKYKSEDIIVETEVGGVKQFSYVMKINDINTGEKATYRTLYVPEPTAIDTFYSRLGTVETKPVNIVLNKPVTHSDCDPAANTGQMAVDGVKTGNPTRWVSNNNNTEHWIEIDLQGEYVISSFQTWRDMSNTTQTQSRFQLQAWIDGDWGTLVSETNYTGGATYYADFAEVATTKVRYYIPAYENNRVRLFEIEVLGKKN